MHASRLTEKWRPCQSEQERLVSASRANRKWRHVVSRVNRKWRHLVSKANRRWRHLLSRANMKWRHLLSREDMKWRHLLSRDDMKWRHLASRANKIIIAPQQRAGGYNDSVNSEPGVADGGFYFLISSQVSRQTEDLKPESELDGVLRPSSRQRAHPSPSVRPHACSFTDRLNDGPLPWLRTISTAHLK